MKNYPKKRGFSAVEILVFVIIIAIIAAIAIPNLLESKRQAGEGRLNQARSRADEASAVLTLRTIVRANTAFHLSSNGKYATLPDLNEAELLDAGFAANGFKKSGYTFSESLTAPADGFCASAVPSDGGAYRIFGVDQSGVIYASSAGGGNVPVCSSGILNLNGTGPLE